jgi:uncharacterized membrane protein YphA (DoxX/SURF4 family)
MSARALTYPEPNISKFLFASKYSVVSGYLQGALGRAQGEQPTVSGWYAWLIEHVFLPNPVLFSYLVAFGEVLVGIALIAGFLVGFSACQRHVIPSPTSKRC